MCSRASRHCICTVSSIQPVISEPITVRVVDAQVPRAADRQLVQVAVGVLIRSDDSFLLTSRPEGKAYAGYWEFPGGKLEVGETIAQAYS